MSKPHGTRRLANGRYLAWSGDEKSEHATQDGAESWVRRRKHDAHRLDAEQYQMSFDRIGKSLGISTVRVRQLELQAITKLRAALTDDPEFRFWSEVSCILTVQSNELERQAVRELREWMKEVQ